MRSHLYRGYWIVLTGRLSLATVAADTTLPEEPTTTDGYQSVFADYQSQADTPLKSWREANDEVAEQSDRTGDAMSKQPAAEEGKSQAQPEPLPKNGDGHVQH